MKSILLLRFQLLHISISIFKSMFVCVYVRARVYIYYVLCLLFYFNQKKNVILKMMMMIITNNNDDYVSLCVCVRVLFIMNKKTIEQNKSIRRFDALILVFRSRFFVVNQQSINNCLKMHHKYFWPKMKQINTKKTKPNQIQYIHYHVCKIKKKQTNQLYDNTTPVHKTAV